MNFKAKKISTIRLYSIILIIFMTILSLFLHNIGILGMFNIENFKLRIVFILFGVFFIFLGMFLGFKTKKQFKTNKEILNSSHHSRGIYDNVRNPLYSSVLFLTIGLLLLQQNYILLVMVGIIWLTLSIIIIYTEETKLIKKLGDEYLRYTLRVNRLIPWFSHHFKQQDFNEKDLLYLDDAVNFLDEEIIAPVMGIYLVNITKAFLFRKGLFFATDKGIGIYFYGVVRGQYGQLIPYGKISSFVHGKNYFGYFVRFYTIGTSINLYFIKKGDFDKFITYVKERVLEHEKLD